MRPIAGHLRGIADVTSRAVEQLRRELEYQPDVLDPRRAHTLWLRAEGVEFESVIRIRHGNEHRERYLFQADCKNGSRIGVLVNPKSQLVLRVNNSACEVLELAASRVEYDKWFVLSCRLGTGPATTLQLRIDDRVIADQYVEGLLFESGPFEHLTVGANRAGEHGATIDLAEHLIHAVLTPDDRRRIAIYLRREAANVRQYVEFSGNEWLATDAGWISGALENPNAEQRPRFRRVPSA